MLKKRPSERCGAIRRTHGATDIDSSVIRSHPYFSVELSDESATEGGIDWETLLEEKACIVPVLDNSEDTSYFDDRTDR
jgi:hypothetical protein